MKTTPKILIVEDEKPLQDALVDKFTSEKFTTYRASDGQEGLAVTKRVKPDIILLDIVMPNMDGMTMLKLLRQESWGADIPVILLTNLSDFTNVADAVQHHAFDFLVKSNWTLDAVVATVRQRLGPK
jgi:DNA-binding response OmpR family regulator